MATAKTTKTTTKVIRNHTVQPATRGPVGNSQFVPPGVNVAAPDPAAEAKGDLSVNATGKRQRGKSLRDTEETLRDPKRIDAALTVPKVTKRTRPETDGRCPKCGRFNDPFYPECLNEKACATRVETAQNYNTYVLNRKQK
jgi:hypothetical protein